MAKWIYVVESNCKVPSREDDFIRWYHTYHLPERLAAPGFVGAQLYADTRPRPQQPKFLAVYRIESDDIEKTMAQRLEVGQRVNPPGKVQPGLELLDWVSRTLYQEVPCPP